MISHYSQPAAAIVLRKIAGMGTALWKRGGKELLPSRPAGVLSMALLCFAVLFLPLLLLGGLVLVLAGAPELTAATPDSTSIALFAGTTAVSAEVKKVFDDIQAALKQKFDGFESRLRDVENAGARMVLGPGAPDAGRPGARESFRNFLRGTAGPEAMQAFAPQNGMRTDSNPDGGYFIPQEVQKDIEKLERDLTPLRRWARVIPVRSDRPEILVNRGGIASGWVGEAQDRPETAGDELGKVALAMGEIYAQPEAAQRVIDDSAYDIDQFVTEGVAEEFSVKEGDAFVNGNGGVKPRGFLTYPFAETDDDVRAFGTLQFVKSGAAGAFAATNPGDRLIELVHKVRAPYRQGAAWWMNSATLAAVRKLKDGQNNYLWRPGIEAGQAELLCGYPIIEDENAPDIAADSFSIGFGNWRRFYAIGDHVSGVTMLRDPLTKKGFVRFYTRKRIGGNVVNSQAVKFLKFAA